MTSLVSFPYIFSQSYYGHILSSVILPNGLYLKKPNGLLFDKVEVTLTPYGATKNFDSHEEIAFEKNVGKEVNAVTSIFSFFQRYILSFNPFTNKPWFLRVCSTSLLKTLWEKEKLLVTSNFSFSHSVFYPFGELSTIFIKLEIVVC